MTEQPGIRFLCRECRTPVTADLRPILCPPQVEGGVDMVPSGYLGDSAAPAHLAPTWHREMGMPVGWPMLSPADVIGRPISASGAPIERFGGCCGPSGFEHLNIACANGHPVAVVQTECYLPHVAVLEPARVVRVAGGGDVPRVVFLARYAAHQTFGDFCADLHTAFGFETWYGEDLPLILGKWGCQSPARIDLVWLQSGLAAANGLPMRFIQEAFAEQEAWVRLLLA